MIHRRPIDREWAAEFRGFFFGEGHLGISTNGKPKKGRLNYSARAQITLRDDDIAMIHNIQSVLGGNVWFEGRGRLVKDKDGQIHHSKPYAAWRATSAKDVALVCAILDGGVMPSKKRREIQLMRRFLATFGIKKHGPKDSREEIELDVRVMGMRKRLHQEIKAMHAYGGRG